MESVTNLEYLHRMREALRKRATAAEEEGADAGFTLIELMVVLLIMAILLAIAIPTFLGVKGSAQDRSAQSDLTNAAIAAKSLYTNSSSYGPTAASVAASLQGSEPEMTFGTAAVNTTHAIQVSVSPTNGYELVLVDWSQTGRCWAASDNNSPTATADGLANGQTVQGVTYGEQGGNNASCSLGASTVWSASGTTYPQPS